MIIAVFLKSLPYRKFLYGKKIFSSLHLSPFLVIAFRKDVIIQVLIGAHCSNPF